MAVSGSKNYTITRADIVEAALRKTGNFDQGESIPGSESSAANQALNLIVKEWSSRGIDIFVRDDATLFLQKDQQSYLLGSTAHATTSFVETALSATEAGGETVISVASSAGMTAADNIGIKINDNTIHWSTIASVDSATQVTIADATDGAASSGNKVYAYTTKITRPQKVVFAYRRDVNGIDTEVTLIGEDEYQSLSNKGSSGPPLNIFYRQQLTGKLFVWPVDGGSNWDKLGMVLQFPADDFDVASNNPGFPIEWGNALIWALAADLAPEYGLPLRESNQLFSMAEKKLNDLLDYDTENASVSFAMGYSR